MKKLLALVLAVIMVMSLMAACGNTENTGTTGTTAGTTAGTQGSTAGTQGSTGSAEFSYPMDTDVVLTEWRTQNTNISNHYGDAGNFDALPLAGWLEEATGIKVEYVDDYTDGGIDLERMWNSGEYEDIINLNWAANYVGGVDAALEDEVIIPLNDVIDKWMPNFKAWMEANPTLAKEIMTEDGQIYGIPNINSKADAFTHPTYYRADILAEMGEEEPTTMEGWYNLLKKVKAEYPNMVPCGVYSAGLLQFGAFAHAYDIGYAAAQNGFAVKDGKVYWQKSQDSAKAFIQEMAKWYKEGLLSADWAVKGAADFNKDIINGDVFMAAGWITGQMQSAQVAGRQLNPNFQLKHINTPSVNGEAPTHTYANALYSGIVASISTTCENVEVAARLLDYRWSEEGFMLCNFGKEGVSYDLVDGKAVFKADLLDATHADFPGHKESILEGDEKPWVTSESLARFSMGVWPFGMEKSSDYFPQLMTEKCCADYLSQTADSVNSKCWDNQLPSLSYSYDEGKIVSLALNDLNTLFSTYATECINGNKACDDTTWAAFLAEAEEAGLLSAKMAIQAAYDRFMAR